MDFYDRRYTIGFTDAALGPADLMRRIRTDINAAVPTDMARFEAPDGEEPGPAEVQKLAPISASATGQPISGVPDVDSRGQGGLLDVALSPNFVTDRTLFWSFTEPRQGGNGTSVARGVLSADRRSLTDVRVIFRALPTYGNNMHFGSRLAFGPDGNLYITLGERSDAPMRRYAQQLDAHLGKIVRIRPDGSVPGDNPFVGQAGAQPEIWTIGHRNLQAAAFDPQGRFWVVEHGTNGGDELNLIQRGRNYGWPLQAYGEEYSGAPIPNATTTRAGMEQPVYYWDPVIAPSGAQFYTGSAFPAWRNNLFVGALKEMRLVRLVIENNINGTDSVLRACSLPLRSCPSAAGASAAGASPSGARPRRRAAAAEQGSFEHPRCRCRRRCSGGRRPTRACA